MNEEAIQERLKEFPDWEYDGNEKFLVAQFEFPDYVTAVEFVIKVAEVAETQKHHPDIFLSWGKVIVKVQTHEADYSVTEKDFMFISELHQ